MKILFFSASIWMILEFGKPFSMPFGTFQNNMGQGRAWLSMENEISKNTTDKRKFLQNALFLAWRWRYKISALESKNENVIFQRVDLDDTSVWKTFFNAFLNVSKQYGSRASVIEYGKWNFKNQHKQTKVPSKSLIFQLQDEDTKSQHLSQKMKMLFFSASLWMIIVF